MHNRKNSEPREKSEENISNEAVRQGNISLILDSYNDIFSDFDPRKYSERALSDDFLYECKKATLGKEENDIELRIFVPKDKRSVSDEHMIRNRLKRHFHKHWLLKEKEMKKIRKEGVVWVTAAALLILFSATLHTYEGFFFNILFVLTEPAGWFSVWTGFDKLFFGTKEKEPDFKFYKTISKAKINFYDY